MPKLPRPVAPSVFFKGCSAHGVRQSALNNSRAAEYLTGLNCAAPGIGGFHDALSPVALTWCQGYGSRNTAMRTPIAEAS